MDKPKRSEFRPARERMARLPEERRQRIDADADAMAKAFAHRTDAASVDAWFARLDALNDGPFMPEGREQPPMPTDAINGGTVDDA